jgi:hypothetical protein
MNGDPSLPAETAPYPDPPPFFTRYTDSAYLKRDPDALNALREQGVSLEPPPPPTDRWTSFGVTRDVEEKSKSVEEEEGAPQLFPEGDFGGSV